MAAFTAARVSPSGAGRHSTSEPLSTSHLPASTFTLGLHSEASALATQKSNGSFCTCSVFDSLSQQVFSYLLWFLPCGWGPAWRSAQQAESGEAITACRMNSFVPARVLALRILRGCWSALQGFTVASPPIPRGIWLQLSCPLGLSWSFYPLPACLHISQGTSIVLQFLFCCLSPLISAPLVSVFPFLHGCPFTRVCVHTHTCSTTMKSPPVFLSALLYTILHSPQFNFPVTSDSAMLLLELTSGKLVEAEGQELCASCITALICLNIRTTVT